jgi:hypothetical protein
MRITIIKGEREDRIDAIRADGSEVRTTFPHKGPLPHDLVHLVVESQLGIDDGFWGMVANGRHPEEIAAIAKAEGHASATRATVPGKSIVAIVQAERAVECFEADLWSDADGDPQTIREVIAAGCDPSLVPAVEVDDAAIADIRSSLAALRRQWSALGRDASMTFEWGLA